MKRGSFRCKIRSLLVIILYLSLISPSLLSGSDENIHPGSWVYPALRSFELLGAVTLEPDIPYSRGEVELYLNRILRNLKEKGLQPSPRQRFLLTRLRDEFQGKRHRPAEREDSPAVLYRAGRRFMGLDLSAGPFFRKREYSEKGELDGLFIPDFIMYTGGALTYETSYILRMEPERGENTGGKKPSERQRSFRGLTSEFERGYLAFNTGRWRFIAGREYIQWGSGRDEGLILSMGAGSLDHVGVYYELGRFEFSTIHAVLHPSPERRLAGHRFRIKLPGRIYLGISETVLYTGRGFDYTYLLPVGSYYANQYNERSDDNIMWGLDCRIPAGRGGIIRAELLIDDFQYEGRGEAPDKLGFKIAAEKLISGGGWHLELLADYTFIDIYTYSHKDSLTTRYVAGSGDPGGSGIIGSSLGPDAERWHFRAAAGLLPRVTVTLDGEYIRRGEGSDLRPWREGYDPNPPFPSGTVTREKRISLSALYDLGGGSFVSAGGGVRKLDYQASETDRFVHIGFVLDM